MSENSENKSPVIDRVLYVLTIKKLLKFLVYMALFVLFSAFREQMGWPAWIVWVAAFGILWTIDLTDWIICRRKKSKLE